jgi:5-formyltetrahydrofolate cyclo-ligase
VAGLGIGPKRRRAVAADRHGRTEEDGPVDGEGAIEREDRAARGDVAEREDRAARGDVVGREDRAARGDVAERKAELRARCRAARAAIPAAERARSAREVEARLFAMPAVREARTVMLFSSLGTEVPTGRMAERLWREGRRVVLPAMGTGEIEPVEAIPGESMARSSFGPLEPANGRPVPLGEIDVVVVPGLAFDRRGNRLGYGGGHYDRFLRRLGRIGRRPARPAVLVGIGFGVQLVDEVPAGDGDEPLDVVVTDAETVTCRPLHRPEAGSVRPPAGI